MVLGYMCETHEFVTECDVNESGQRICPECGMAVTGVVGSTRDTYRTPPEGERHTEGDIRWDALEYDTRVATCMAFDIHEAAEQLVAQVDNPQTISEIRPRRRAYRQRAV